jgi:hypothetical protein
MSAGSCSLFHLKIRNKEQNKQLLLPTYVYTSSLDQNWFQENKPLILQNIIDISMEHLDFNVIEKTKEQGRYSLTYTVTLSLVQFLVTASIQRNRCLVVY